MKAKKLIALVLVLMLITGVCGCMKKQDNDVKMENMKSYACDKYGREFVIEGFCEAKDESYTNILMLNDGDCVFNVYQSGKTAPSDDYPKVVVNKKFVDDLKNNADFDHDIYANFIFANGNQMTLEYAKEKEVAEILDEHSLLKVVVVVVVNESISGCAEDLFGIYKEIMAFSPKYIDFEVIQVNSVGSDLNDMLHNLPALYDSAWEKHSEVIAHLSVTDVNISSSNELIKGSK